MKLFRSLVTEKKKKGDTEPKTRPILIAALNAKDAKEQLSIYWGKPLYKWTRPDLIADFSPK